MHRRLDEYSSSGLMKLVVFAIGHAQLLLQEFGEEPSGAPKRVEVLFKGVIALKVCREYGGIHIRVASDQERHEIFQETGTAVDSGYLAWIIESNGMQGYVVALTALIYNDEGRLGDRSYFRSSFHNIGIATLD